MNIRENNDMVRRYAYNLLGESKDIINKLGSIDTVSGTIKQDLDNILFILDDMINRQTGHRQVDLNRDIIAHIEGISRNLGIIKRVLSSQMNSRTVNTDTLIRLRDMIQGKE